MDIVIVIYVDNILVVSLEFEQHVREVETVIQAHKGGLAIEAQQVQDWFLFHSVHGGCFGQLQEGY